MFSHISGPCPKACSQTLDRTNDWAYLVNGGRDTTGIVLIQRAGVKLEKPPMHRSSLTKFRFLWLDQNLGSAFNDRVVTLNDAAMSW